MCIHEIEIKVSRIPRSMAEQVKSPLFPSTDTDGYLILPLYVRDVVSYVRVWSLFAGSVSTSQLRDS